MTDREKLREYYDTEDQSDTFNDAELVERADEVLVSTSIRLSKTTLDQVRSLAAAVGVPATTLMREWIEARVSGGPTDLVVAVTDLEQFISARAHRAS